MKASSVAWGITGAPSSDNVGIAVKVAGAGVSAMMVSRAMAVSAACVNTSAGNGFELVDAEAQP